MTLNIPGNFELFLLQEIPSNRPPRFFMIELLSLKFKRLLDGNPKFSKRLVVYYRPVMENDLKNNFNYFPTSFISF